MVSYVARTGRDGCKVGQDVSTEGLQWLLKSFQTVVLGPKFSIVVANVGLLSTDVYYRRGTY